jgi:hypothetical protein
MTDATAPDAHDDAEEPSGDTMRAEEAGRRAEGSDAGDRVAQRIRRVLDHGFGGEG